MVQHSDELGNYGGMGYQTDKPITITGPRSGLGGPRESMSTRTAAIGLMLDSYVKNNGPWSAWSAMRLFFLIPKRASAHTHTRIRRLKCCGPRTARTNYTG